MLDAHPEITMARPARPEPKVFCDDEVSARGAEWYRATWFAHATPGQLLGDKSTSYLEDPEAPQRAAAVLGAPHVLVVLRDPVKRAISNWRFSTENGLEKRPLEVAIEENLRSSTAWDRSLTSVSPFAYLERGRYVDYLAPWADTFPDTTHVVFLDELIEQEDAVADLWRALGVATVPGRLETSVNESDGPPPALTGELWGRVRAYFASSDRDLSARLGRDLPW
jgi:hypothetical protein